MAPRILLDTNVLIRYLQEPRKLSREQLRLLDDSYRRNETIAISAITLLEVGRLVTEGRSRFQQTVESLMSELQEDANLTVLPITFEIAAESAKLIALRDPADRAIVATARVHRLKLLTSDQKIIDSKLASVVA